jgi:hypothetical protein
MVQAHLGKKGDPICKITRTKWTGDMVQVESACLASMKPQYTHTHTHTHTHIHTHTQNQNEIPLYTS